MGIDEYQRILVQPLTAISVIASIRSLWGYDEEISQNFRWEYPTDLAPMEHVGAKLHHRGGRFVIGLGAGGVFAGSTIADDQTYGRASRHDGGRHNYRRPH